MATAKLDVKVRVRKWRWWNHLLGWYPSAPTAKPGRPYAGHHPAVEAALTRAAAELTRQRDRDARHLAVLEQLQEIRSEVARLHQLVKPSPGEPPHPRPIICHRMGRAHTWETDSTGYLCTVCGLAGRGPIPQPPDPAAGGAV